MGRRPLKPSEALVYVRKVPTPPQRLISMRLTEEAWEFFVQHATTYGYVRPGSQKPRGLVRYLQALTTPAQQWTDTRPDYLRDLSTLLLDPAYDSQRRIRAEGSVTSLFNPDLPHPNPSSPKGWAPGPKHAVWWDPDLDTPKRGHMFVISQLPIEYYANLALTWGIDAPHHQAFNLSRPNLCQHALEAIGRGHLTPAIEYHNPHPPKTPFRQTPRPVEIQW